MQNGLNVGYSLQEVAAMARTEPPLAAVLQSQTALIRRHEQLLLTVIEERLWSTRSSGVEDAETAEDVARALGFDDGWMACFSTLGEIIEGWGEAP